MVHRALTFLLTVLLTTSIGFLPNDAFSQSDSRLSSSASASKGGKSKSPKGKKGKPSKGGGNSKGNSDKKGKNKGKGGTATPTATLPPDPTLTSLATPEVGVTVTPVASGTAVNLATHIPTEIPTAEATATVATTATAAETATSEPTSTATGTSTPEPTETPQDTETPEPTITVDNTGTPDPTPTRLATPEVGVTITPVPSAEATATVATTATAAETATSEPTSTATGTSTPEPTETPQDTETPEPTAVIADTDTPEETAAPEDTPEQCLSDEAVQEEIDAAAAEAGIESPDEMTCPEELPADGEDSPEIGPLSYVEQMETAPDGSIVASSKELMQPESWELCSTTGGQLPEPPLPNSGSSSGGGLPEPPVPSSPPAPTENKPCCFFTYADKDSGGGTYKPGDGHDNHAKNFEWPQDCAGRTFDCALNATTNPFSVRFCKLKGTDKTYRSLSDAADALKCGAQRHLTLYHANPNYGIKGCNMIRNACRGYTDRPVNSEHINMGCSVFGNPRAICTAASNISKGFQRRCNTFKNESFVLTGNTVVNWMPSRTGSCSWRHPDGYAIGSNYGTMRKIKVTKDGFISCRKANGKWVEDAAFCGGVEGYLKEGPNRPAGLTCASVFG